MIYDHTDMADHIEMMTERLRSMAMVGAHTGGMEADVTVPYFATMVTMLDDVLDTAKSLGMTMRSKP